MRFSDLFKDTEKQKTVREKRSVSSNVVRLNYCLLSRCVIRYRAGAYEIRYFIIHVFTYARLRGVQSSTFDTCTHIYIS